MTNGTRNNTMEFDCPQCGAPVPLPGYADAAVCAFCGSTLTRQTTLEAAERPSAAPQPADIPEHQTLHSVQCSQCAGPLDAFEGRRVLQCRHCGVRVAIKEHGGLTRWHFLVRVSRLQAAAAGAAWLREYPGIARQAREARLVDAQLVYAPIWEHRALVAGWEFGRKLRTRTELVSGSPLAAVARGMFGMGPGADSERLEIQLVEEEVKEARLQERRFYQPATDFAALGATRPRVTGRELLLPLLAGELDPSATVLEAGGDAAEVTHKGTKAALQPLSGAFDPDSHLYTFRESTTLLYYPLWIVLYQQGNRPCRVVVNGRNGTVNSAVAPADNDRRVALLAAQVGGLAIVVAVLGWLASIWESGRVSFVAAAVIVSLAAIFLVARFRKVGEVEYHEPFSS